MDQTENPTHIVTMQPAFEFGDPIERGPQSRYWWVRRCPDCDEVIATEEELPGISGAKDAIGRLSEASPKGRFERIEVKHEDGGCVHPGCMCIVPSP